MSDAPQLRVADSTSTTHASSKVTPPAIPTSGVTPRGSADPRFRSAVCPPRAANRKTPSALPNGNDFRRTVPLRSE
jgi:hypothetical protein